MAAAFASAADPRISHRDREVLRFARMLEQLQATFYAEALKAGRLTGEPRQFAETVGRQEQAHLRYLRDELGAAAPSVPRYDFGGALHDNVAFVAAAVTLEDTGVAAYDGQAENVSRATLRGLARVMSVESRHAAWARAMAGKLPAPVAADVPISAAAALKAIQSFMA
jgi:rubrerythrin